MDALLTDLMALLHDIQDVTRPHFCPSLRFYYTRLRKRRIDALSARLSALRTERARRKSK